MLIIGSNFGLFVFGLIFNMLGPALPYIIATYDFSLTEAGYLYSMRGLGFILAVFLGSLISDWVGRRKVILLGAALWVVGLFLFVFARSGIAAFVIWLFIGLGFGAVDIGLNALVADVSGTDKGAALNRLHFWFGIGSLCGPLLAGAILTYSTWQVLFSIAAVVAGTFLVFMYKQKFPVQEVQGESPWSNVRQVWTWPTFFLGIIMFGYTGVGTSLMGWINVYLVNHLSLTTWSASIVLALYSIGLSVGRLISSAFAERVRYESLLLISAVGSFLAAATALAFRSSWVVGAGFGLTGLFFAALLPTSLAVGSKSHPTLTGTITGVLISFGSVGRTVVPGLVGAIADRSSLTMGLRSLLFLILCMVGSALYLSHRKRKPTVDVTSTA